MTTRKSESAPGIPMTAAAMQDQLAVLSRVQATMMRDALAFNAELLDFARRRVGRDIEATSKLAKCTSMPEAAEVMTGFCQQVFENYAEETARLMEMGRKVVEHEATAVEGAAKAH